MEKGVGGKEKMKVSGEIREGGGDGESLRDMSTGWQVELCNLFM